MEKTLVQIGCEYLVKEDVVIANKEIKAGTVLYAWFCGHLVMVDEAPRRYYDTTPARIIKLIEADKLELLPKK